MNMTPLYALMRKSHLTLERVADGVGVSTSSVRNWGTGKQVPKGKHLEKLSKVLGVPVEAVRAALPGEKKRP